MVLTSLYQSRLGQLSKNAESKEVLADLTEDGDAFIASHGGRGGKGNEHYKSSTRQAPP